MNSDVYLINNSEIRNVLLTLLACKVTRKKRNEMTSLYYCFSFTIFVKIIYIFHTYFNKYIYMYMNIMYTCDMAPMFGMSVVCMYSKINQTKENNV